MKMTNQLLLVEQLDKKLAVLKPLENFAVPTYGWIYNIRTALKMSLRQLGNRLSISAQSVKEIELREAGGSISLKTLGDVGNALDLKLVYGFIPRHESIDAMIEKRAREIAAEIVQRTSNTMKLEGQENTDERINKAIENKTWEIKTFSLKALWN
jgi:predicted DNA-binding mobile mystery protein A